MRNNPMSVLDQHAQKGLIIYILETMYMYVCIEYLSHSVILKRTFCDILIQNTGYT